MRRTVFAVAIVSLLTGVVVGRLPTVSKDTDDEPTTVTLTIPRADDPSIRDNYHVTVRRIFGPSDRIVDLSTALDGEPWAEIRYSGRTVLGPFYITPSK